MLTAIFVMVALGVVIGVALGWSAVRFKVEGNPLAEKIDKILPQTQCGQCGFPGCKPYANAIARGEADINQCPPGGEDGVKQLAELLGVEPKPLNAENGSPKPKSVAIIDEATCIGCTLCIQACPVDAIVGAAKQMHTIVAAECTGCELCLPPCPVDCILMVEVKEDLPHWKWKDPAWKDPARKDPAHKYPVVMMQKTPTQPATEKSTTEKEAA
jgi:electron transport complex protein RnfB